MHDVVDAALCHVLGDDIQVSFGIDCDSQEEKNVWM